MKTYEVYTCRRKALGWTRQELENRCGIDVEIVNRFEDGMTIYKSDLEIIREAIYDGFKNVSEMDHYRLRILELAIELQIEDNADYAMQKIAHMMIELGKMQFRIIEEVKDQ